MEGQVVPGSLYVYAPNQIAPVFFAVAFFIAAVVQCWQCYHYKCWRLTWLFPVNLVIFAAGFAVREYGAFNYTFSRPNLNIYLASTILIYMAPPGLELANYHILGRTLYYVPHLTPIHPGRVLTTFGTLAAVVEVLNAIGVTYGANTFLPANYRKVGQGMLEAGLVLQLVVLLLFIVLITVFLSRLARANVNSRKAISPLYLLSASTGLILARTVYRTIEYFTLTRATQDVAASGADLLQSPLLRHEWYFYVFEATLMLLNAILWTAFHPRRYLPESKWAHLDTDGVTEVEGRDLKDDRSWIVTCCDPFGWFTSPKKTRSQV